MFLTLTATDGARIAINLDNVTQIRDTSDGTLIIFLATDQIHMKVKVKEPFDKIIPLALGSQYLQTA